MIEKDLRNQKAKFEMFSNEVLPYSVAHQRGGGGFNVSNFDICKSQITNLLTFHVVKTF